MKISVARHSGFCMGVKDAVLRLVDEINYSDRPLFVYGPLIHNPQTISILSSRGMETIYDLTTIDTQNVAIRTHGIPLEEFREIRKRAEKVVNLTCTRVARVQSIIKTHAARGFHVIITGDEDHAEVKSLKSYASSGVTILTYKEDIEKIEESGPFLLVSQTTFSRELFYEISKLLEEKIDDITVIDTICDSTRKRQDNVIAAIEKDGIDLLVVVGGKNSSNTTRLAQIGTSRGIKTIHVETEDELHHGDFSHARNVLLTAGASTPGWIINNVLERLYDIKYSQKSKTIRFIKNLVDFFVRSNTLSTLGAWVLTNLMLDNTSGQHDQLLPLVSAFYIFSMYTINNYFDRSLLKTGNTRKYRLFTRLGKQLMGVALLSVVCALLITYHYGWIPLTALGIAYFFGSLYSTAVIRGLVHSLPYRFLRKLYSSKIITTAGWLMVVTLLPYLVYDIPVNTLIAFSIYTFLLVFLRHYLYDMIAFQGDMILGRETLPLWTGIRISYRIICVLSSLAIAAYGIWPIFNAGWEASLQGIPFLMFILLLISMGRRRYQYALKYELAVDSVFPALGVLYLLVHAYT